MRLLEEFFSEFTEMLDGMDELYRNKRTIDEKTYQFICFALSIKARSKYNSFFNGCCKSCWQSNSRTEW